MLLGKEGTDWCKIYWRRALRRTKRW